MHSPANPIRRRGRAIGLDLGQALYDEPAAIYLYSLTSATGQKADLPAWSQRPDDYLIATIAP